MSAQNNAKKSSGYTGKSGYKKDNGSKKKRFNDINSNSNVYLAIPLYLIIALVPLIIYVKKIILSDPGNLYWDGQTTRYDIFSYYKMVYLLIFTGAGLLLYLFMRKDNPFEKAKRLYYIPTGIFALLALVSAFASDYKQVAFIGFIERFEGAWVLLAYCVILFLAMNVFRNEKSIKILFGSLIASAVVISILGAFQYFGINYFNSGFITNLITPTDLKGGKIDPHIFGNLVYSTLYNPNYVGSYAAMLIPILIVMLVWLKKVWQKAVALLILLLAVINLVGSTSSAGVVGTGFAIIILLITFRKNIWLHKWVAITAVVLLAGGLTAFNFATNGSVTSRLAGLMTNADDATVFAAQQALDKSLSGLSDVKLDDKKLQLVTDKGSFIITVDNSAVKVTDENNAIVTSANNSNTITFTDKRFEKIKIIAQPDKGLMGVYYNDFHLLDVVLTQEGLRSPSNPWLTYRNDRPIEAFGFKGIETIGSNRGYIWSRSLPLLKDTILIGHGPDTYALYFPQYDFLNKLKLYQTGSVFIDKAHNLYLQTAVDTGVLSLLALLTLFAIYFISSVRIYFRGNAAGTDFLTTAGIACFAAFCGYAVAALFNDSVVSVASVFWVLLGLGIGINVRLAGEKKIYN